MTQTARADLKSFLDDLEPLLTDLGTYQEWVDPERLPDFERAQELIAARFENARRELDVHEPTLTEIDTRLEERGLTGNELDLKLRGFRGALRRFADRATKGRFRRVLRWANVVLGSLAGVVGAAEPIKEFKESVEASIEDNDAEGNPPPES